MKEKYTEITAYNILKYLGLNGEVRDDKDEEWTPSEIYRSSCRDWDHVRIKNVEEVESDTIISPMYAQEEHNQLKEQG